MYMGSEGLLSVKPFHAGYWKTGTLHARIQEFLPGWGGGGVGEGVQALLPESALTTFFLALNLFYSFTVVYQWFI